jgi:hypothetical protein
MESINGVIEEEINWVIDRVICSAISGHLFPLDLKSKVIITL